MYMFLSCISGRPCDTVAVNVRLPLLAIAVSTILAGGTSAATSPGAKANPNSVQPLMFKLEGNLLDAICPDAIPHPMSGIAPAESTRSAMPDTGDTDSADSTGDAPAR